jgi:hypothetical protein
LGILIVTCLGAKISYGYPQVANSSFETDTFTVNPGYCGSNGPITGWTSSGATGLNPAGGNPFANNGLVPHGMNVAFIQGSGSLSQSISGFEAGKTYRLTYYENARAGYPVPNQEVRLGTQILIASHSVAAVESASTYTKNYLKRRVEFSVSSSGTYTLIFTTSGTGDYAVLLDKVCINEVSAPYVENGGFETNTFTVYPGYVGSNGPITGWTSSGCTGLNPTGSNNPFADNGKKPEGNNVGFIQYAGSLSQTINGFEAGVKYRLTYYENARIATMQPTLQVTLGSQTLVPLHTIWAVDDYGIYGLDYRKVMIDFTVPNDGAYTLTFAAGNSQDSATLIDKVSIKEINDPCVINSSFENDTFTVYPGYVGSNFAINGWTSSGPTGLNPTNGNSPFANNGITPDGAKVAFIQYTGSLSQNISGFEKGVLYRLTYYENARTGTANPTLEVRLGTQVLIASHSITPVDAGTFTQPYYKRTADFYVPADGTYSLSFNTGNSQDSAVLLDKITITRALHEDLTRGHYLLVEKGLQLQALAFPDNSGNRISESRFYESGFSGINTWGSRLLHTWDSPVPGPQWGRWTYEDFGANPAAGHLDPSDLPYLNNLVSFQYWDDGLFLTDETTIQTLKNWFAYNREHYPDVISYDDQKIKYSSEEINAYILEAKPDMTMFCCYPFEGELVGDSLAVAGDDSGGDFYDKLKKYRDIGLTGLNNEDLKPFPYAIYLQTYVTNGHTMSETELRLNQFAIWAFGYKFACAYTYTMRYLDASNSDTVFFDGYGDSAPTTLFYQEATVNKMSRRLGPALVRLVSTDIRIIMGQHREWVTDLIPFDFGHYEVVNNSAPDYVTTGVANVTGSYLSGVSAVNLGTKNNGYNGDVLIGFFKPLHESFDGSSYSNQKYFMIVNALCAQNGTAYEARQQITVDFNFGSSGITGLQRMRRTDGVVENIVVGGTYTGLTWTQTGTGTYRLVLTLDGGTGDLFKYNTGAPFVASAGQP